MSTLQKRIAELTVGWPRGWKARLARHCNVKPPSVSDWVSGETKTLDGENLVDAAAFFGVVPKWLASGKGPKYPATNSVVRIPGRHIDWPFSNEVLQRLENASIEIVRACENHIRLTLDMPMLDGVQGKHEGLGR